jgi:transcriptional regulator with XRE-family HTH domain
MNTVERVKQICKERKIPISKLEKDLGFGNGYIGQLKKGTIPDDRLVAIANYLDVSVEYLLYGDEKKVSGTSGSIASKITLDKELTDALKIYFTLTDKQKKHVLETIKILGGDIYD